MTTTMTENDRPFTLDANVIDRLANVICGDEMLRYRSGRDLVAFFESVGWRRVGDIDGSRREWVVDMLTRRNLDDDALRRVVLRLADPREYIDDAEAMAEAIGELDKLLAVEGFRIDHVDGRPVLVARTPQVLASGTSRITSDIPIEQTANLADVVSDEVFAVQLQKRLSEARSCWENGAPTAAIIMMGSVLEGVLYDFARTQSDKPGKVTDHLQSLMDLATEQRWVSREVFDYMNVVRGHRNLVHPKKQHKDGYNPDDDIVRITWNVVVAALNDLAKFRERAQ